MHAWDKKRAKKESTIDISTDFWKMDSKLKSGNWANSVSNTGNHRHAKGRPPKITSTLRCRTQKSTGMEGTHRRQCEDRSENGRIVWKSVQWTGRTSDFTAHPTGAGEDPSSTTMEMGVFLEKLKHWGFRLRGGGTEESRGEELHWEQGGWHHLEQHPPSPVFSSPHLLGPQNTSGWTSAPCPVPTGDVSMPSPNKGGSSSDELQQLHEMATPHPCTQCSNRLCSPLLWHGNRNPRAP